MQHVHSAAEGNNHAKSKLGRVVQVCVCLGLLVCSAACPGNFVNSHRAKPVCAKRDCKTGEIIDDGCSADGKCLSCSNDCGGKVAPRNGPASSSLPMH